MQCVMEFLDHHNIPYLSIKTVIEAFPDGLNGVPWNINLDSGLNGNEKNLHVRYDKKVSWDEILKHPKDFICYGQEFVSNKDNLDFNYVLSHSKGFHGIPWDMDKLSMNCNVTWDYILKHPKGIHGRSWSWTLGANPNISWDNVRKHLSGWDLRAFVLNRNLDWTFVLEYPEGANGQPWNMRLLSQNKSNNSMEVFRRLPFCQKEFKEELEFVAEEIKYRPGNSGYKLCKEEFNEMC